jgi:hypothetical protein
MPYVLDFMPAYATLKAVLGLDTILALCTYVDKKTRTGARSAGTMRHTAEYIQANRADLGLDSVLGCLAAMDIRTDKDIIYKLYANLAAFDSEVSRLLDSGMDAD